MKARKVLLAALGLGVIWQAAAWIVDANILPAPWLVLTTFAQEIGADLGAHLSLIHISEPTRPY